MTPPYSSAAPANLWISASAGTGKTHLIVQRLLALMNAGTEPRNLLCLTFTRAAAEEMHHRLHEALQAQAGRDHAHAELLARFEAAPPAIQTLHTFCHQLLREFPMETLTYTGFAPSAALLTEEEADIWRQSAIAAHIHHAAPSLTERYGPAHLEELLLAWWQAPAPPSLNLPHACAAPPQNTTLTEERLYALSQDFFSPFFSRVQEHLRCSSAFTPSYAALWLTAEGKPRKRLFQKPHPWLIQEQETVKSWRDHNIHTHLEARGSALQDLFLRCITHFQAQKRAEHRLDFQDLIDGASLLFEHPTTHGPLTLALARRFHHLILDEAQDTSSQQWRLIQHMAEALLAHDTHKTFCIVGDAKQAIYSFQDAHLSSFYETKTFLKTCASLRGIPLQESSLSTSYRSVPAVLRGINTFFQGVDLGLQECFPAHYACEALQKKPGLFQGITYEDTPYGQEPSDEDVAAHWIAQIRTWPAPLSDIWILFPQRNRLFHAFIQACAQAQIRVDGSRRRYLQDHPLAQHFLHVGRWLVNPHDDWAFAAVLRGVFLEESADLLPTLGDRSDTQSAWEFVFQASSYGALPCVKLLHQWIRWAQERLSPSELFYRLLLTPGEGHPAPHHVMHAHFGPEGGLWMQEFLAHLCRLEIALGPDLEACMAHMRDVPYRLQEHLTNSEPDILRIATIHSVKGSQAPIVIIPDAWPSQRLPRKLMPSPPTSRAMFWPAAIAEKHTPWTETVMAHLAEEEAKEYARLLYVAMTRAQNRLYLGARLPSAPPDVAAPLYNLYHALYRISH